ncbi:carboxylating nicotinate-nucleotide diphosphorylase [Marinicellulosiphila megalodicopiae]|uniref:carboxylating nicotinate-nucleotide diphosphorylase n=1 Tax=Marinicellulosiphila megalodicopiae TaxID=2724896 RepID=UPI003BB15370
MQTSSLKLPADLPYLSLLTQHIKKNVEFALEEDIQSGDITAELIEADSISNARVITREHAVICGVAWVDETFKQFDDTVKLNWFVKDGDKVEPNQTLLELSGNSRSILTAERTALNFLQLLSATATLANQFTQAISNKNITILDTRKTIPGLRMGQKYAALVGGCGNHRIGLYDMFLIKENHIAACGGIEQAINKARSLYPDKKIEIEVENEKELERALACAPDVIMLDNFQLKSNLAIDRTRTKLESSGNITLETLATFNEDVDFVSSGQITKNVTAIDLSLRLID